MAQKGQEKHARLQRLCPFSRFEGKPLPGSGTDEEGFIDHVHVTPANAAECTQFETMIEGADARRVLADKAYASKANRTSLKGRYRDGYVRKAARSERLKNASTA